MIHHLRECYVDIKITNIKEKGASKSTELDLKNWYLEYTHKVKSDIKGQKWLFD